MFDLGSNQILLLTVLLLVGGVGTYVTYVRQQSTLDTLNEKVEAQKEKKEEVESLRADRLKNKKRLSAARTEWRNRYTTVPDSVTSTEVAAYLTALTQRGFRTFDVASAGPAQRDGYSAFRFNAEGEAYYSSLYRLLWRLENRRPFYQVEDLRLSYLEKRKTDADDGGPSLDVLVSFKMTVEAIYGVVEDLPQPLREAPADEALPTARNAGPALPASVGPEPTPSVNPFYPLVFEKIPPNEDGRLNVEAAHLVSVLDDHAVFATGEGTERVQEGDRVYLGKIVEVDASAGRVVARLNKGGIVERVERVLNAASPSRESETEGEPQ